MLVAALQCDSFRSIIVWSRILLDSRSACSVCFPCAQDPSLKPSVMQVCCWKTSATVMCTVSLCLHADLYNVAVALCFHENCVDVFASLLVVSGRS